MIRPTSIYLEFVSGERHQLPTNVYPMWHNIEHLITDDFAPFNIYATFDCIDYTTKVMLWDDVNGWNEYGRPIFTAITGLTPEHS